MGNVTFFNSTLCDDECTAGAGGVADSVKWGNITGDISNQDDLAEYIGDKLGDIGKILDCINGTVI